MLNNILTVVDQLLENSTKETTRKLLGSAQIQHQSSSRILKVLDNLVKAVDSMIQNQRNKTFDIGNLTIKFPNVGFSVHRDMFRNDVFFIAVRKEGNVSVSITTDNRLAEITSQILAVIKLPNKTFIQTPETLYSFCFTEPTLFLTGEQLQNLNGSKKIIDKVVDSNILSASILERRVEHLSNPIVLTFKKSELQNEDERLQCQFWNLSRGKFSQ